MCVGERKWSRNRPVRAVATHTVAAASVIPAAQRCHFHRGGTWTGVCACESGSIATVNDDVNHDETETSSKTPIACRWRLHAIS
jgi:hypothetical protein